MLLAAHARGLASYWRSVPLLASPAGREALGLDAAERPIGLLHLGRPRQRAARARARAGRGVRQLPALAHELWGQREARGLDDGLGLRLDSTSTRTFSGAATTRLRPARLASYSASSAALNSVS